MKNFFLQKQINRKLSREFGRVKCFKEYQDVKRMLVLFDLDYVIDVETFIKMLRSEGKEVFALAFFSGKLKDSPKPSEGIKLWTSEQLTPLGKVKPEVMAEISVFNADTLVDLLVKSNPVMDYVLLTAKAEYRVGFRLPNRVAGDFMIEYQPDQSFMFLVNQMHFYLKTLRTK
jgi:hypothetical protein